MIIQISQIDSLVLMSFFCYHQSREIEIGPMLVLLRDTNPPYRGVTTCI